MQYFRNGLDGRCQEAEMPAEQDKSGDVPAHDKNPDSCAHNCGRAGFTSPRYSGARYKESAPNDFMKEPFTVLNNIYQKISSTWNFFR
jgi:hypothetical protein